MSRSMLRAERRRERRAPRVRLRASGSSGLDRHKRSVRKRCSRDPSAGQRRRERGRAYDRVERDDSERLAHGARVGGRSSRSLASSLPMSVASAGGDVGAHLLDRPRLLEQDLREHRDDALARERRTSRRGTRRARTRARRDPRARRCFALAAHLLGRHVRRRADEHARLRAVGVSLAPAHDAEIDQHRLFGASADEEHVRRLEIAVHEAARVDLLERRREPRAERDASRRDRAPRCRSRCRRSCPSSHSIARYGGPTAGMSWASARRTPEAAGTAMELREDLGLRREAGDVLRGLGRSTFTATVRPETRSRARKIVPMPPVRTSSISSKRSARSSPANISRQYRTNTPTLPPSPRS